MNLTNNEIKDILLTNPTKKVWDAARADASRLQMHVLGYGLETYVSRIENYESQKALTVRKKYCKSNRDLFARVLRPIDNIWNGRGGGSAYLTSEANDKRLRSMTLDIYKGYSLQTWAEKFWAPRYIDDPMGLIFNEVDLRTPNGVYPTYKSTRDIFDALLNGRRLEYLVLKTAEPDVFRVIDDAKDILVKLEAGAPEEKGKVSFLKGAKYPQFINWFDTVPAMVISDMPKDGRDDAFMSPIQDEVELADIFLREGSIANIYRFKHGFPLPWKYPEVCGNCKGTKAVEGKICPKCNGSGIKLLSEPGDTTVYAWPTKDEPEIREKGGFVSPDLDYLKYADESLEGLEELITRTHWGTDREKSKKEDGTKGETATGRFIDTQPVANRLTKYAKAAESVEEFIVNNVGYYHRFFVTSYKGASINLGRRFMIENPDEIWTKYCDSRAKGAPLSALDDLLRDYYETKYQGNQQELQKYLNLIKLEPGVHLTMGEAKANLPWSKYMEKVFFPDYLATKSDLQLSVTPVATLIEELEAFAAEKAQNMPQDPMAVDPKTGLPYAKPKPAGAAA
jgi:hypothetical protein